MLFGIIGNNGSLLLFGLNVNSFGVFILLKLGSNNSSILLWIKLNFCKFLTSCDLETLIDWEFLSDWIWDISLLASKVLALRFFLVKNSLLLLI